MKILIVLLSLIVLTLSCLRHCPCLGQGDLCYCDVTMYTVTCSELELDIDDVLPDLIPPKTRYLSLKNNWVVNEMTMTSYNMDKFQELVGIDLSENRITQVRPLTFSNLRVLSSIDLSHNRIRILEAGVFGENLPGLKSINLANNKIVLLLDNVFVGAKHLLDLDLRNNPIIYISPHAFASLHQLEDLRISEANLTSNFFASLHPLKSLKKLHLTGLSRLGEIPQFAFKSIKKLESINLDKIPKLSTSSIHFGAFWGLTHLHHLAVTRCNISVFPTKQFRSLRNLTFLDLSRNPLEIIKKNELATLVNLQNLNLEFTRLKVIEKYSFQNLLKLSNLILNNNRLSSLHRESFPHNMTSLRNVTLTNNPWFCDCTIKWLIMTRFTSQMNRVTCTHPKQLQGRNLMTLHTDDAMKCVAPKIYHFDDVTKVAVGNPAELKCQASGIPQPIVTWHTPTGMTSSDSTLKFNHVSKKNSGLYRCVATNDVGDDVRSTNLEVFEHVGVAPSSGKPPKHVTTTPILFLVGVLGALSFVGMTSCLLLGAWGWKQKKANDAMTSLIKQRKESVGQNGVNRGHSERKVTFNSNQEVKQFEKTTLTAFNDVR